MSFWTWVETIAAGLAIAVIALAIAITVTVVATVLSWFFIPLVVAAIIWVAIKLYRESKY